jgi:alkanesulfonate monooxygenase SsuD/methylene tetrahydromethanopterin reductase-like flavin-dependent oxidoreductase (luciferase family)
MRDYIQILRKIFRREGPVTHAGREISLPYTGPGATGLTKPLKSILHMNPEIPIFVGAVREAMVKLTAELADGWLPLGFVPGELQTYRPWLEEGFRRAGGGKSFRDFEIWAGATVVLTEDVRAELDRLRPTTALLVGGVGHRNLNYHKDAMVRQGFGAAADRIQELYLSGRKAEAEAAVPEDYLDAHALVGPPARVRERYRAWADCGITGFTVTTSQPEALALIAELAGAASSAS